MKNEPQLFNLKSDDQNYYMRSKIVKVFSMEYKEIKFFGAWIRSTQSRIYFKIDDYLYRSQWGKDCSEHNEAEEKIVDW